MCLPTAGYCGNSPVTRQSRTLDEVQLRTIITAHGQAIRDAKVLSPTLNMSVERPSTAAGRSFLLHLALYGDLISTGIPYRTSGHLMTGSDLVTSTSPGELFDTWEGQGISCFYLPDLLLGGRRKKGYTIMIALDWIPAEAASSSASASAYAL